MTTAAASTPSAARPGRGLHIALWIVQVLLAGMFLMAGVTKTFTPVAELAKMMPWVADSSALLVRFVGVSELLGGLGLILPALTRIRPVLTVAAAAGLVVVMVLAAGLHVYRGELSGLPINFILGGLAAFVAWGRSGRAAIAPRG